MCVNSANNVSIFQHKRFINTSAMINDSLLKSAIVTPNQRRGFCCLCCKTFEFKQLAYIQTLTRGLSSNCRMHLSNKLRSAS